MNGDHAKPNRHVREGDRIRISRGAGRFQDVIVRIVLEQHVKKSEARALYDDVTPKPTPEEIEMRRAGAGVSRGGRGRRHTRPATPARDPPVQRARVTRLATDGRYCYVTKIESRAA